MNDAHNLCWVSAPTLETGTEQSTVTMVLAEHWRCFPTKAWCVAELALFHTVIHFPLANASVWKGLNDPLCFWNPLVPGVLHRKSRELPIPAGCIIHWCAKDVSRYLQLCYRGNQPSHRNHNQQTQTENVNSKQIYAENENIDSEKMSSREQWDRSRMLETRWWHLCKKPFQVPSIENSVRMMNTWLNLMNSWKRSGSKSKNELAGTLFSEIRSKTQLWAFGFHWHWICSNLHWCGKYSPQ